jgi:hypothetical protein
MISRLWHKLIIIIAMFISFTYIYKLLEKPQVYFSTLGKLTHNYIRIDTGKNDDIVEANAPFSLFIEKKASNWDAAYYLGIRDSMYASKDSLAEYRYAFYPLFPIVWKVSHTNVHGIILLNYFLFGLTLIILSSLFLKDTTSEIFFFILALLLPTTAAFRIPYTESLFALTFSIALIGLLKRKYWIYFMAMLCFSMTRPAGLMFIAALGFVNLAYFFRHRKIIYFIKECFFMALPIITGVCIVTLIQYHYSHSWTSYVEACGLWTKRPYLYKQISDWSIEGFSMNTFAIFFFAIPCVMYAIIQCVNAISHREVKIPISLFSGNQQYIKKYAFNISISFITAFSLFTLWASGYEINGFSRYTMATPFFFIILFQLPEKLKTISFQYKLSAFIIVLFTVWLFLLSTEYAGDLFRFKYLGLYLLIPIGFMAVIEQYLSTRFKIALLILLVLPCTIWHAYLLNMYLGNFWIFT